MCYPDVPCHGVEPGGHRRGEDLQQPRAHVEGGRARHGDDPDLLMSLHIFRLLIFVVLMMLMILITLMSLWSSWSSRSSGNDQGPPHGAGGLHRAAHLERVLHAQVPECQGNMGDMGSYMWVYLNLRNWGISTMKPPKDTHIYWSRSPSQNLS